MCIRDRDQVLPAQQAAVRRSEDLQGIWRRRPYSGGGLHDCRFDGVCGRGDAVCDRRGVRPVSYTHLDVYKRQEFIANALNPARVINVFVSEKDKACRVIVPDNQLSLAIGKEGQNARLAAKLTGWKIDIKSQSQAEEIAEEAAAEVAQAEDAE